MAIYDLLCSLRRARWLSRSQEFAVVGGGDASQISVTEKPGWIAEMAGANDDGDMVLYDSCFASGFLFLLHLSSYLLLIWHQFFLMGGVHLAGGKSGLPLQSGGLEASPVSVMGR